MRCAFLMEPASVRLRGLGGNPLQGSDALGFADGYCPWNLSLGQRTGDGKFDGEAFWVGCGCFFLGGRGRGRGTPGHVLPRRFRRTTRVPNSPVYVIYYMLSSGGFAAACLQAIAKGVLDPRCPGQTRALFKLRQPVDLFHALKTVKGLLHLVPPRTPRSSGYGVLCTCGSCCMLFLLNV